MQLIGSLLAAILSFAGLGFLLIAAGWDVRDRIIPTGLVGLVIGVGLVVRVLSEGGSCWISFVIAVAIYVTLMFLSWRGVLGEGDARMIPAATLLVSPTHVPAMMVAVALASGMLGLFYLVGSYALRWAGWSPVLIGEPVVDAVHALLEVEAIRIATQESVPFGVAIFFGAAIAVISGAGRCSYGMSC
jgi:Flp pilus assembly protein protease CpaA